jgi:hypothetical protein
MTVNGCDPISPGASVTSFRIVLFAGAGGMRGRFHDATISELWIREFTIPIASVPLPSIFSTVARGSDEERRK